MKQDQKPSESRALNHDCPFCAPGPCARCGLDSREKKYGFSANTKKLPDLCLFCAGEDLL